MGCRREGEHGDGAGWAGVRPPASSSARRRSARKLDPPVVWGLDRGGLGAPPRRHSLRPLPLRRRHPSQLMQPPPTSRAAAVRRDGAPATSPHALQPPDSLTAPLQQPRGQWGKGRAEPPGERGELRLSAPSHPNRARERILRQLLVRSCFALPFGSAPAKNSSASEAGALPKGPKVF
jgi:hypothetical protein